MTQPLDSKSLARKVIVPSDCPDIILAVAPCRSGTTAQLRVFAENGIPAIYQPVKAVLRGTMADEEDCRFVIPNDHDKLFIKETLGPYTAAESTINPLEILLEAGVPPEKITMFTMMREPLSDISSWIEQFSFGADTDTLVDNAIKAYKTVGEMNSQAKALGINTQAFVYEALRDNEPEMVASRMFHQLGLPFSPIHYKIGLHYQLWELLSLALPSHKSLKNIIAFEDIFFMRKLNHPRVFSITLKR